MNINDVKEELHPLSSDDRLELIFARQKELMEKYHGIEAANGLQITPDCPVNLHDAKGQFRLKDFAWRTTEELGEALEAFRTHPEIPEHYDEEVADALHFLVEFTILAGLTPDDIAERWIDEYDRLGQLYLRANKPQLNSTRNYRTLLMRTGAFIEALATTCNCLKNKPWKQTQMMTDTQYFNLRLAFSWIQFIKICISANIKPQHLFSLYFKKSEVNKFRQRSNY